MDIPMPGSPRCRFRCDKCDQKNKEKCKDSALNILMIKAWHKDWKSVFDFISHLPSSADTTDFINTCDKTHEYFITVACKQKNIQAVKRLVDYKCNIDVCDAYGESPTRIAVENEDIHILNILLNDSKQ